MCMGDGGGGGGGHTQSHAQDSNTGWSHTHTPGPTNVQVHNVKSRVHKGQGSRDGRTGQQMAPDSLREVGGTSFCDTSSKEGDKLIKVEPCLESPKSSKECDDTDDTVPSLAESVH